MYAFAEFTRQGHWSARACGECHEPLARDYNRHDRANRAGAGSWLRYDVPVACWGVARNAPFGRLGILPIKSDTSCMIGHRPAGSRLIAYLGRDIPHILCGKIWAGPIPLGKIRGTSFLARCMIETASSRHGETAAGCGSMAAFGSYPTKEDRSRSDVRQSRQGRDLRRDRNIKRDSPSFWSCSLDEMPAARHARGGFSLVKVWRKRHDD